MAIEKICDDDRITIVLDPTTGALKGAQRDRTFVIKDGGTVIGSSHLEGEALSELALQNVLPDTAALLAQNTALMTAVATALAAETAAVTARTSAENSISGVTAERDYALQRVSELEHQISNASKNLDADGFAILSPVQVRLALIGAGIMLDTVTTLIGQIPDPAQRASALTYWEYASTIHRDHSLITMLAGALGLTSAQVDALWAQAALIT